MKAPKDFCVMSVSIMHGALTALMIEEYRNNEKQRVNYIPGIPPITYQLTNQPLGFHLNGMDLAKAVYCINQWRDENGLNGLPVIGLDLHGERSHILKTIGIELPDYIIDINHVTHAGENEMFCCPNESLIGFYNRIDFDPTQIYYECHDSAEELYQHHKTTCNVVARCYDLVKASGMWDRVFGRI